VRGAIAQGSRRRDVRGGSVMNIEMARSFFLWCTLINYAILVFWCLLFLLTHDRLFGPIGRLFHLSTEQFDMINVAGITLYKTGIFLFNLVPCIAFYLIR
jgi:hypothetical protein